MDYLSVKNWTDFQQYKDREPKWIKIYRSLLVDYKFSQLTDAEFGQLVRIWLLASQVDNKIPNDASWIKDKTGMTTKPNINKFVHLEFLLINGSVQNCTDLYLDKETDKETDKNRDTCTEPVQKSKSVFGAFKNIKLTNEEKAKLDDRFTQSLADSLIEELSEGIASKGYKYKDHYATILNWARRKGYGKQADDRVNDNVFLRPIRKEAGKNAGG